MYCDPMYKHMHNKRTYVCIYNKINTFHLADSYFLYTIYVSIKSQPPDKYTRPSRNRLNTRTNQVVPVCLN